MAVQTRIARSATAALIMLWESGFFRVWKSIGAIDAQLGKIHHHFSTPQLSMALKRAKHLTRRGTSGHYEYIQKYPFSAVDSRPSEAKKKGKKK